MFLMFIRHAFLMLSIMIISNSWLFSQESLSAGDGNSTGSKSDGLKSEQMPSKSADTPSNQDLGGMPCEIACCPCGSKGNYWVNADYLMWWIRGSNLPPLLTFSPEGASRENAGVLGSPGTQIIGGNTIANDSMRSGFRIGAGTWLNESHSWGVQTSFFMVGSQNDSVSGGSNTGTNIVSRPFFNVITGMQDAQLVSFPGVLNGTATIAANGGNFYGVDAMLRRNIFCNANGCSGAEAGCFRLDVIGGYQFFQYSDGVGVTENLFPQGNQVVVGTKIVVNDTFNASNVYNGAFIGLMGEIQRGRWWLQSQARIGMGGLSREVTINGQTTISVPGQTTEVIPSGVFAGSSNIGSYNSCSLVAVPQVDFRVGYEIRQRLYFFAGYTFLLLPDVARGGEQIDLGINPNLIPGSGSSNIGPQRPAFSGRTSDLWAQGISLGLQYDF